MGKRNGGRVVGVESNGAFRTELDSLASTGLLSTTNLSAVSHVLRFVSVSSARTRVSRATPSIPASTVLRKVTEVRVRVIVKHRILVKLPHPPLYAE